MIKHPSLRWLGPLIHDPNLLHLNRHSVSLAFFIGIFSAFTPLPGQTFLAALLAFWLGANLPISIMLIWISNPITIPPMFYLTYKLGNTILGTEPMNLDVSLTWEWFSNIGSKVMLPLMTGSIVCGLLFGTIGYFSIKFLWRWKVIRDWETRKIARQAENNE